MSISKSVGYKNICFLSGTIVDYDRVYNTNKVYDRKDVFYELSMNQIRNHKMDNDLLILLNRYPTRIHNIFGGARHSAQLILNTVPDDKLESVQNKIKEILQYYTIKDSATKSSTIKDSATKSSTIKKDEKYIVELIINLH
jgi:methionyl-tRNA synthetase